MEDYEITQAENLSIIYVSLYILYIIIYYTYTQYINIYIRIFFASFFLKITVWLGFSA